LCDSTPKLHKQTEILREIFLSIAPLKQQIVKELFQIFHNGKYTNYLSDIPKLNDIASMFEKNFGELLFANMTLDLRVKLIRLCILRWPTIFLV
jgi:hypothetical protein